MEGAIEQMVTKLDKWRDVQHLLDADIRLFESEHELGCGLRHSKELDPKAHTVTRMLQQWDDVCGLVRADIELFKCEHQLWTESQPHVNDKQEVDLSVHAVALSIAGDRRLSHCRAHHSR